MIHKIEPFIICNIMKNHIFINDIIQGDKLLPCSDSANTKTRFFQEVIKEITFKSRSDAPSIFITETASTTLATLPRTRTAITYSANTVITFRTMPTNQVNHPQQVYINQEDETKPKLYHHNFRKYAQIVKGHKTLNPYVQNNQDD